MNATIGPVTKTLCAPSPYLSCFGCCPPIRPAHYDPLDYVSSLRKEFAANRHRHLTTDPHHQPIVGYHCWALGFLDPHGRCVGCLLHPRQNGGKDLRHLIDYGDKCRRETCFPAAVFSRLPGVGQDFWLPLVQGLTSFHYSSHRANPLFHLLSWGPRVLELLRLQAHDNHWSATELLHRHSFLLNRSGQPKAHRYLLRLILESRQHGNSTHRSWEETLRDLQCGTRTLPAVTAAHAAPRAQSYTHRLPLKADFRDFCRLGLGLQKLAVPQAMRIQHQVTQLARRIGVG